MIRVYQPTAAALDPFWKEMQRLWRQDSIRRHHRDQLEELRRSLILGQVIVWVVWDHSPHDRGEWCGPRYGLAIVLGCECDGHLQVQFAAGVSLHKWTELMAGAILDYAKRRSIGRLTVYLRRGWKQEFGSLWSSFPGTVTFARDPGRLYVDVYRAA